MSICIWQLIDEGRQSVEHTEPYVPFKIKCQLRVEANRMQACDEWREQKPTHDVTTTACNSVPPISYGMTRVRVLESVTVAKNSTNIKLHAQSSMKRKARKVHF